MDTKQIALIARVDAHAAARQIVNIHAAGAEIAVNIHLSAKGAVYVGSNHRDEVLASAAVLRKLATGNRDMYFNQLAIADYVLSNLNPALDRIATKAAASEELSRTADALAKLHDTRARLDDMHRLYDELAAERDALARELAGARAETKRGNVIAGMSLGLVMGVALTCLILL